ncbi:hypothetical protein DMB95_08790 [Campylobacter sp. MIT 12-8780]|uniref:hypothetical protein n=1 Tax=unclassified Campylobacter TaxID=2593542 RepID=UPI00115E198C|nr:MULTISPECIES: hypothetical protein [unclassified Campylobacter]NDJ27951.1 hypothetical protein [Campylobacter sp. MIT 19-121]TQR40117.1 hypothetical protein DMB95_08790 [Campylobacter sp. MIT 12-8780]
MQTSTLLVTDNSSFITLVASKIARALAYKEAKKTKQSVDFLISLFSRQVKNSIKTTTHFVDRVVQRFTAEEADILYTAISRAVRNTKPLENGRYHNAVSQKFVDDSGIVIVLERQGELGAVLVTTYKQGGENLLSDEEVMDLRKRGIL